MDPTQLAAYLDALHPKTSPRPKHRHPKPPPARLPRLLPAVDIRTRNRITSPVARRGTYIAYVMVDTPTLRSGTVLACTTTMSAQELPSPTPQDADERRASSSDAEQPQESLLPENGDEDSAETMTMEGRKAKLEQLRARMRTSARANRQSLVEESAKAKITARDAARLERQKKLADTLRTQAEAEANGEDVERSKNWEWTIEDNENWEKKLARKARRADYEFHDDAHAARRRYKKDLDLLKPDLEAYNRQKEQALGLVVGTLSKSGSSTPDASSSLISVTGHQMVPTTEQRMAADNFYRDANTLLYADNKPTEDAIDRVVGKINRDIDKKAKFSRKRTNEEEGDITYINERNRVFNKKIARYYDKYTTEIRASFERGTAL